MYNAEFPLDATGQYALPKHSGLHRVVTNGLKGALLLLLGNQCAFSGLHINYKNAWIQAFFKD